MDKPFQSQVGLNDNACKPLKQPEFSNFIGAIYNITVKLKAECSKKLTS